MNKPTSSLLRTKKRDHLPPISSYHFQIWSLYFIIITIRERGIICCFSKAKESKEDNNRKIEKERHPVENNENA